MSYVKGPRCFTAGEDIEGNRLLKVANGELKLNTGIGTDDPIGISPTYASKGESLTCIFLNAPGTLEMTASGPIALNGEVFASQDGKIQAKPKGAGTYRKIGIALEAALKDGEIIEVLPYGYNQIVTVAA